MRPLAINLVEWIIQCTEPSGETDLTRSPTQGLHKRVPRQFFLDELGMSDKTHPLSPTYMGSNGATTAKLWNRYQWQARGRSRKFKLLMHS